MTLVVKLLTNLNKTVVQNSERCSLFLFVLSLLWLLSACQPQVPNRQQAVFTGPIMGTEYRVTVISGVNINQDKVRQAVLDAMNTVNQSMSNYLPDSEVSQFNRLNAGIAFEMSADFTAVMQEAQQISVLSQGAFDVTLAKVIDAWGFGPDGDITEQPNSDELTVLKQASGYHTLRLEGSTITKTQTGVEISLSAIAKGYAVDKVAQAIESLGIVDYLVNIGGELRASGKTIDGHIWRVGIEKPHILGGIQQIALLENQAIATSGDYRNYLIVDGQQFSHTIDPITFKPVLHKLALVSVIADRASTADALATAMMAMGEVTAWEFAQSNNIAAYLIVRSETALNNDKAPFDIKYTKEFERNLQ